MELIPEKSLYILSSKGGDDTPASWVIERVVKMHSQFLESITSFKDATNDVGIDKICNFGCQYKLSNNFRDSFGPISNEVQFGFDKNYKTLYDAFSIFAIKSL